MFCLAVILGPAIATLFAFDVSRFPDSKTYLQLANLNLDQYELRGYRVIIPFAAGGLNYLFGGLFAKLAPAYFTGNFSLPFSFFLINTCLVAWFGLLVYRFNRAYNVSRMSALIGCLAVLTCRYTAYAAALPLVDSLFYVVLMLVLVGIKEKNTGMLVWAIFIGPFAKESFIFMIPLIFFFSHIDKKKQLLYFLLAGVLVLALRYLYSLHTGKPALESLTTDVYQVKNLVRIFPKVFSFYGLNKILMNVTLWLFVPLLLLIAKPEAFRSVFRCLGTYIVWYLLIVFVQILLSGSIERMFYLAMPVVCVVVAISVEELRKIYYPAR
jgi:hypothetical protein